MAQDEFVAEQKLNWRFPAVFWVANVAELFERAAFYGMFIALTVYLTDIIGFTDVETGYVAAVFASTLYLFPTFWGAIADKIGFRNALMLAFGLLSIGYTALGLFPATPATLLSPAIIVAGGAFVKPVISATGP